MGVVYQIQSFVNSKLQKLGYNRKAFALNSRIPYTTIISLSKGLYSNTSIQNIVKLANYFNCSIDAIIITLSNDGKTNYILLDP